MKAIINLLPFGKSQSGTRQALAPSRYHHVSSSIHQNPTYLILKNHFLLATLPSHDMIGFLPNRKVFMTVRRSVQQVLYLLRFLLNWFSLLSGFSCKISLNHKNEKGELKPWSALSLLYKSDVRRSIKLSRRSDQTEECDAMISLNMLTRK